MQPRVVCRAGGRSLGIGAGGVLWIDNTGGRATQTSAGWDGDKTVWLGDGSMDCKWDVVQDKVCKRSAPK